MGILFNRSELNLYKTADSYMTREFKFEVQL